MPLWLSDVLEYSHKTPLGVGVENTYKQMLELSSEGAGWGYSWEVCILRGK